MKLFESKSLTRKEHVKKETGKEKNKNKCGLSILWSYLKLRPIHWHPWTLISSEPPQVFNSICSFYVLFQFTVDIFVTAKQIYLQIQHKCRNMANSLDSFYLYYINIFTYIYKQYWKNTARQTLKLWDRPINCL